MSWKDKAREVQRENKINLNSVKGGYVIVTKFSVETQEKMAASRNAFSIDEKGLMTDVEEGAIKNFHRLVLKGGLLDTNFEDDDGKPVKVDDEFIEELFKFPELEWEIFNAITEHNAPLQKGSASNLEIVPNGTLKEGQGSSQKEPRSLTEGNRTRS